jgi:hypothetical protein
MVVHTLWFNFADDAGQANAKSVTACITGVHPDSEEFPIVESPATT